MAEPEPEAEERLEQVIEMTMGEEEEEPENPFAQTTFRNHEGNEEAAIDVTKEDVLEALGFESNMFEGPSLHILRSSQSMHVQSTHGSLAEEKPSIEKALSDNEEQLNIAQANLIIEKMNRRSSNLTPTHAEESKAEDLALRLEGMEDPFKEQWTATAAKVKSKSKFVAFQSYSLKTMIVKANDDLRQENLAMQLMKRLQGIFDEAGLKNSIYLRPYEIFITSSNSGMIEFIPDTTSIDALKKRFPKRAGTQ